MMWLKFLKDDAGLRHDYEQWLLARREQLRTEICDPNVNDTAVQQARGALAEIERMRRELTAEERNDASRKLYDKSAGRPASPEPGSVRPIRHAR